jgi:hypothetical protein
VRIKLIFAWYDLWVGFFFDRKKQILYIFPIPCVAINLQTVHIPKTGHIANWRYLYNNIVKYIKEKGYFITWNELYKNCEGDKYYCGTTSMRAALQLQSDIKSLLKYKITLPKKHLNFDDYEYIKKEVKRIKNIKGW